MFRDDSIFSLPCDRYTPLSLARKIGASAILESASFARGKERYSILMTEPAFHIVQDDGGVAFLIDGRRLPYRGKNTTGETIAPENSRSRRRTFSSPRSPTISARPGLMPWRAAGRRISTATGSTSRSTRQSPTRAISATGTSRCFSFSSRCRVSSRGATSSRQSAVTWVSRI